MQGALSFRGLEATGMDPGSCSLPRIKSRSPLEGRPGQQSEYSVLETVQLGGRKGTPIVERGKLSHRGALAHSLRSQAPLEVGNQA